MCSPMSLSVLKHQGGFVNAALLVCSWFFLLFLTVERLQTPSLSVLFLIFLRQTLHSSSRHEPEHTKWRHLSERPPARLCYSSRTSEVDVAASCWFWLWPGRRLAAILSSMFLDELLYQSLTELRDLLKVFSLSAPAVTHRTELQPICARQHVHW